jgi:hypothetical protein
MLLLLGNPLVKVDGRHCQYAEDRMYCQIVIINKFIVEQFCIESQVFTSEMQSFCFLI